MKNTFYNRAFLLFLLIFVSCLNAMTEIKHGELKTYYYELVKIVDENKKVEERSEDGQFYTFTRNTCYESDKKGLDAGLGHLSYVGDENNLHVYSGPSFYGKQTTFFFNSDYSRVNIKTSVGMTYVLSKKPAPDTFVVSDHKAQRQRMEAILNGTYIPPTTTATPIPSTDNSTQTTSHRSCRGCGGTGNCSMCKGKGWYMYQGKVYDCSVCHGSGRCGVCHGKGHCN